MKNTGQFYEKTLVGFMKNTGQFYGKHWSVL
jgi:hypothetical protein